MDELLDISPENIIVIEDSINGLKSAKTAGMKTIALCTSFTRNEIKHADYIAKDYGQLMKIFGYD